MKKKQEFMIKMRDGVRLQTYLFFPEGQGPFPTLLSRCHYGVDTLEDEAHKWVEKEYAVVLQNVRGRHKSEGGTVTGNDPAEDGYDTMDWIAAQPWCNGHIGTFGRSAMARLNMQTAYLAHPANRAMALAVLPYRVTSRLGGIYMFSQIPQWLYLSLDNSELRSIENVDWMPHLFKLPVTSVLDDLGGPIERYREVVKQVHQNYLQDPLKVTQFERLKTPNLMITGWYDHCLAGPMSFFERTMGYGTSEQKENTHLVVGPWDHSLEGDAAGEYDFGPEAALDFREIESAFFAHYLKGSSISKLTAPVKIFVMGKNQWRDENEWPLSRAKDTKLYLSSKGEVSGAWIRGRLSWEPPEMEKPDHYSYDPSDPCPTWGGANSGPARVLPMKRGSRDQQITLYRKDVLTYYSDPLPEPVEVTGMLKLVLFAASSVTDTDFTAKLMDVAPDGNARLLSDGVIRCRFRNGVDNPEYIKPEEVYQYEIDLWFTSNEFQAGHHIALAISSSNFPRFNRNLNTGGDNEQDTDYITADQTIFHDSQHPSHLVLPIIKG